MTEKMQEMLSVIRKHDETLRKQNDCYKCYFTPNIPDRVQQRLVKYYDSHLPIQRIIAFYDSTLLNSSKAGILFIDDGMYYKFMDKPVYFHYSDIKYMRVKKGTLYISLQDDADEYAVINPWDMDVLKQVLEQLRKIQIMYGSTVHKSSGKVQKIDIPEDMMNKCHAIIHSASVSCGGVAVASAQIPTSDNAVIVPIQIGMIIGLGEVFELNITESMAKSIIASAGATIAGRTVSQILVGWMPLLGNAINTATAAGVTEAIGWIAVQNFYGRWGDNSVKGRWEGMKTGYEQASEEYEEKLRKQAEDFCAERKNYEKERDKFLQEYEEIFQGHEELCQEHEELKQEHEELKQEYERLQREDEELQQKYKELLLKHEKLIETLTAECADAERINRITRTYRQLRSLTV